MDIKRAEKFILLSLNGDRIDEITMYEKYVIAHIDKE